MTYSIDTNDALRELIEVPRCEPGGPQPVLLQNEGSAAIAYIARLSTPPASTPLGEDLAVVVFARVTATMFGPPNDEAIAGHPLFARGLRPYHAYEVESSSWIRALERRNSVHPAHSGPRFLDGKHHFVFAFHDSTFECIARSYSVRTLNAALNDVPALLGAALHP